MGHVPHLYLPPPWPDGTLQLSDAHQRHLRKVLRRGEGETVSYTDGRGLIGSGRLLDGRVERGDELSVPRPTSATLVVAPPSSRDRLRFLVEKTAELGVSRLLWVRTSRTEGRPPAADKARAWAIAALEQSRGAWMAELGTTDLEDLDPGDLIVADPDGSDQPPPSGRQTLLVGPEGGLAPEEVPPGAALLSLGPTVLRVETAAIAATCALIRRRAPSVEH